MAACGEKSLRRSGALEPLHLAFSSSRRLVRILRPVVAPSTAVMAACKAKFVGCGAIGSQIVGDQPVWDKGAFLQELAHQFQCRRLVPPDLDQHVEHFTLRVDGAPEVDHAAVDLEIDLVEMPGHMRLWPSSTTSGYGRAAYEFANGKPIELISGSNLLYLLKEHADIDAKIEMPDDWVDAQPDTGT